MQRLNSRHKNNSLAAATYFLTIDTVTTSEWPIGTSFWRPFLSPRVMVTMNFYCDVYLGFCILSSIGLNIWTFISYSFFQVLTFRFITSIPLEHFRELLLCSIPNCSYVLYFFGTLYNSVYACDLKWIYILCLPYFSSCWSVLNGHKLKGFSKLAYMRNRSFMSIRIKLKSKMLAIFWVYHIKMNFY